jgi:hypothetical protein
MVRGPARERALSRLARDGLICRVKDEHRTTRRWQGAMMRAASRLMVSGDDLSDLRVPVAAAIVEIYGGELGDTELTHLVEVMTPIELHELCPWLAHQLA